MHATLCQVMGVSEDDTEKTNPVSRRGIRFARRARRRRAKRYRVATLRALADSRVARIGVAA